MRRKRTPQKLGIVLAVGMLYLEPPPRVQAEEPLPSVARLAASQQFFQLSQQRTGLLIPLYHYPADVHTNAVFNRLIELKRSYASVPVCAIVNPASGPGEGERDANYVKAIDRLYGAGVVPIGYVSTRFAARPEAEALRDIAAWRSRYPRVQGLFLDEMANQPDDATVQYYARLTAAGHQQGYWPVFANPGTAAPEVFFAQAAADVLVIHENGFWPREAELKGDYFGGYADYPPWTRGLLVHSQTQFDRANFARAAKYTRWVYVTHDVFSAQADPNDPANNPWDELSRYLEDMFRELAQRL